MSMLRAHCSLVLVGMILCHCSGGSSSSGSAGKSGSSQGPTGSFRAGQSIRPQIAATQVAAGHFNADPLLDLAVISKTEGILQVFLGKSSEDPKGFEFELGESTQFLGTLDDLGEGDFNNDGTLDLVVVDSTPRGVSTRQLPET